MPISSSTHRGYSLPGTTVLDTRLGDAKAIKATLVAIDADMANVIVNSLQVASKGAPNGVASLDSNGQVLSSQLPSYVDDVLEYANLASFPVTGESSKIYIALNDNKQYRWSGSIYTHITSGAVDMVAGKTGVVVLVKADVGLGNVDNTSDMNKPVSTAQAVAIAAVSNVNILQNSRSSDYNVGLNDAGKHIFHPGTDTYPRNWIIPSNAALAFDVGTALTFVNQHGGGDITISINTDTMRLAGTGVTGSRILSANGVATALKLTSNEWIISGTNLA